MLLLGKNSCVARPQQLGAVALIDSICEWLAHGTRLLARPVVRASALDALREVCVAERLSHGPHCAAR